MKKFKLKNLLVKMFMVLFLCFYAAPCIAGEKATKKEVISMCNKVLKTIEKEGLASVILKINNKKGPFVWKDSYVGIMDTKEAKLLAHPYLPKRLIGVGLIKTKDIYGKEYIKEFLNVANSRGHGWVDYIYFDKKGIARNKITYVLKSEKENIILLAGIYTDKKVASPKFDFSEMTLPDIKGKKVAFIIAINGYEDSELSVPKKMIEKAGGTTELFSLSKGKAYGMYGQIININYTLDEIKVSDFDAIVFVGGRGSKIYHNNPIAHKIAKEAVQKNKILGAICWAPVTLANANVINGKMVTVNPVEEQWFKNKGFLYTGDKVTIDGKIITANGPEASAFFAKAIIESLNLEQ